ncbi:MAG: XdhC family protein [Alphaproteobacteria bacterium]
MRTVILRALLDAKAAKQPTALVTEFESGAELLLVGAETTGDLTLDAELAAAVEDARRDDRGRRVEIGGKRYFINVFNPPRRMIVVGAVHIAQALVPMATIAGYAVTIVDPRRAFATDLRFPDVEMVHEWPDDAMLRLAPDRRTAVVTLTHDPKLDDPALTVALRSSAFYIGALGSRRTHARRVDRLREAGLTPAEIGRIEAPVGLDIGAVSPAEIAVSILASVTRHLHAAPQEKAA